MQAGSGIADAERRGGTQCIGAAWAVVLSALTATGSVTRPLRADLPACRFLHRNPVFLHGIDAVPSKLGSSGREHRLLAVDSSPFYRSSGFVGRSRRTFVRRVECGAAFAKEDPCTSRKKYTPRVPLAVACAW
jgi:hypothetical protein